MRIYYFLAILISLSFGSLPPSDHGFSHACSFTGLVLCVWWVLCFLAARLVAGLVDQGEVNADVAYVWYDRQTECLRWFALGLVALCLGGFGFGRNLTQLPIVGHSLVGQSIILLLPTVTMMTGLWTAEWLFAKRIGIAPRGIRHGIRWIVSAARSDIGWLLTPMFFVMAAIDCASMVTLFDSVPDWWQWVILTVFAAAGIPILVRRVFPTAPMDESTRQWIEGVVTASGIGRMRIVMWNTAERTHNAMMAGILGRFRVLLLSDRLIKELSREELAMVILHEIAHAKRFHIPLRIGALIPVWMAGLALDRWLATQASLPWLAEWSGMLGSVSSLLATILVLRVVSYRSEFDADQVACRLAPLVAESVENVPANESAATQHLASALLRVTAESPSARKPSWLHPGIHDRIASFTVA